jgi:ribose transport system permease protein
MSISRRIFGTLIIPVAVFAFLSVLCAINNDSLFAGADNFRVFLRTGTVVLCVTFALWINLNSGRFDFSLGSVATLSALISASISIRSGLSPIIMLALAVGIGLVCGLLTGFIYVATNLPPILVSLGMTLFYEGLGFTYTEGKSVSFGTVTKLLGFNTISHLLIISTILVAFMIYLFGYTSFGKNHAALITGQKICVDIGIKEKPIAVICYALTGALMGIVGFLNAIENPIVEVRLNFSSVGTMFVGFLPLYIAGFVGKYTNDKLGCVLGAVVIALVKLSYPKLGIDTSTQAIIEASMLVLFLIYLSNQKKLADIFSLKPFKKALYGNS